MCVEKFPIRKIFFVLIEKLVIFGSVYAHTYMGHLILNDFLYRITLFQNRFNFYSMKKNKSLFCIIGGLCLTFCFGHTLSAAIPEEAALQAADGISSVRFVPDTTRVLDNPLNGWVMYLGRDWDRSQTENFWEEYGYDRMPADSGKITVRVSDYAKTAYLRTGWASMEPEEGKYFWKDPDSRLSRLLESVMERGMKVAFRIVVDGRDQCANTPEFVFDAGAKYYLQNEKRPDQKTPFPQDPVFRKYYEKFVEAFAEEFNDSDKTAFIDGYGLGKWGEGHNVAYEPGNVVSDSTAYYKENTMEWITGLYSRTFTEVPLETLSHMMDIARKIDQKQRDVLGAEGTNIMINNSPASGQEVPHLHIHVIPRVSGDGKTPKLDKTQYGEGEAAKYGDMLRFV